MTHASPFDFLSRFRDVSSGYRCFAAYGLHMHAAVRKESSIKFFAPTRTVTSLSDCESYPGIT
jgi:hypothetical protein